MALFILHLFMAIFCGIMVTVHITLSIGVTRARRTEKNLIDSSLNTEVHGHRESGVISVIIPARNEEVNLPSLFSSLEKQSINNFELIFIDDRSNDSTSSLLEEYKNTTDHLVTIVKLKETDSHFNPKQYALSRGIEKARGEVLLFTDADCHLPPHWVEYMEQCFHDTSVGLVFGPVHTAHGRGFLKKFQVFDHLFRYYYTLGCAGIGNATGGFGNNLAIRKDTLEKIGGYENVGYSPTEDAALISSVRKNTDYRIIALTSPFVSVTAEAKEHLSEVSGQQLRWSSGAIFSDDPATSLGYLAVMIFLMAGTTCAVLSPFYLPLLLVTLSTYVCMSSIAVLAGIYSHSTFSDYWNTVWLSILFAMVYYYYITVKTLLKPSISWKGQKL